MLVWWVWGLVGFGFFVFSCWCFVVLGVSFRGGPGCGRVLVGAEGSPVGQVTSWCGGAGVAVPWPLVVDTIPPGVCCGAACCYMPRHGPGAGVSGTAGN